MTWGPALSAVLLLGLLVASVLGRERLTVLRKALVRTTDRVRDALPSHPQPPGRPIEEIARDAHRIGTRFHSHSWLAGKSSTRYGRSYFAAMAVCQSNTVVSSTPGPTSRDSVGEHLLEVLPPGPELDGERQRVEIVLAAAGLGLGLDDAA